MRGRKIGIAVLLVLATLLWTGFGLGLWAKRQALDTQGWVDTSSNLLENDQIRTALGNYLIDQVYSSAAVKQAIEDVLPPRLDPLAGPAAAGLKEVARRNAPRVLGSAAALTAWRDANREAHDLLLKVVRGDVTDRNVSLNLQELVTKIADQTGLPPGIADRLPPNVAQLEIVRPKQLDTAKKVLDAFETAVWVLLVLALLAFAGAILLSPDRRRTILSVGACLIFAGIALLALRRIAEKIVVDALADAPNAHAVAGDAWDITTSLMVDAAQGTMLFGLFVVSGAWLAGPGRRATGLRRISAPAMRDHPAVVRAVLGLLILLLVIWGPVPWTQRIVTILIFTVIAFLWLEWTRARTLEEFPDVPAGEFSRRMRERASAIRPGRRAPPADRSSSLERLADLHERGVLTDAEFEQQKTAVLSGE